MNSNLFGSEDPWANGWTSNDSETNNPSRIPTFGSSSGYLTSSQLLTGTNGSSNDDSIKLNEENVPESYKAIYSKLSPKLSTVNDLETLVFNKLINLNYLSNYQKSKILDILYDHNLLPPSITNNFYQILGLIGLEIDVPGSGDYVTLQFKLNNLPPLPKKLVNSILEDNTSQFIDPLNVQLASTTIEEEDDWKKQNNHQTILSDPLLTDHSSLQKSSNAELENAQTDQEPIDHSAINKYIKDIRDKFKPLIEASDLIKIKEVPEKEGILFKHINYVITHDLKLGMNGPAGTKKVIRRYSDFVWLLEFLLRKYPFRVIPGLPPKKFSVGSSPDSQFLQRRRRGLHRFLNQLIKHPVLKQEPVVITFLSVPTDMSTWRKQAKIDYSLEFKGEKISTHFINSIWPTIGDEFLKNWSTAEANINKVIEVWTKIVLLVERYEKRQQQIAYDDGKFVEMINNFKSLNTKIYPNDDELILGNNNKDDINSINDSMNYISEFFNKSSQILVDESYSINTIILEKFKSYLDYLYSLQELFERSKRLSVNNINQLQTRIKENETKYNKLSNEDADAKGADLAKLRQIIINDKQEIFQQLNKDWLIKHCCFEEFIMFQETQYLLSELWIDWSKGRFKFSDKLNGLYDNLNNQVSTDMPLNR